MSKAKVLVYGAGPLGSLFAARLQQGGNDVSLLARGQRLADLRAHGIVLVDEKTGLRTVTSVSAVEALAPDDAYDLVLVIMRKNHALLVLPVLKANRRTPHVLFLMNNAAGPAALINALGPGRVLIGFPRAAGYREGPVVHCAAGTPEKPWGLPFGEPDGSITDRTRWVASILDSAVGYRGEIHSDMDAWLKTHVALLMPSICPALYAAGTDLHRLARTRDLVVLAVRAVREGFQVLRALDVPITPPSMRWLEQLPESLLVGLLQKVLVYPQMEIALAKHANAARDELRHLADEFLALAHSTDVPTPAIDRLYPHFDLRTPMLPDGSSEMALPWGWLAVLGGVTASTLSAMGTLSSRLRGPKPR